MHRPPRREPRVRRGRRVARAYHAGGGENLLGDPGGRFAEGVGLRRRSTIATPPSPRHKAADARRRHRPCRRVAGGGDAGRRRSICQIRRQRLVPLLVHDDSRRWRRWRSAPSPSADCARAGRPGRPRKLNIMPSSVPFVEGVGDLRRRHRHRACAPGGDHRGGDRTVVAQTVAARASGARTSGLCRKTPTVGEART